MSRSGHGYWMQCFGLLLFGSALEIPTTHTKDFPEANEESTRLRVLHVRRPRHARFHCSTEASFSFCSARSVQFHSTGPQISLSFSSSPAHRPQQGPCSRCRMLSSNMLPPTHCGSTLMTSLALTCLALSTRNLPKLVNTADHTVFHVRQSSPCQGHARFHCPPDASITFRAARSAKTSRKVPGALPNAAPNILWIHDDGCMDVCTYAYMYPCYPAVADPL